MQNMGWGRTFKIHTIPKASYVLGRNGAGQLLSQDPNQHLSGSGEKPLTASPPPPDLVSCLSLVQEAHTCPLHDGSGPPGETEPEPAWHAHSQSPMNEREAGFLWSTHGAR